MTKVMVTPLRVGGALLAAVLAFSTSRVGAVPVASTMNAPVVVGNNVTLSWTAVAGATSYRLAASLTRGGAALFSQNVGNTTSVPVAAPDGIFFVRVFATDASGEGPASADVEVRVGRFATPAAPTDLSTYINGTSALVTWSPGVGGGSLIRYRLYVGTSSGASDVGMFPLAAAATQLTIPNLPQNTNFFLRIVAENQGGLSPASNEAILSVPIGGGCSAPPARTFTSVSFGRYVQFSWTPVPGAAGYRLNFATAPGGPVLASQFLGPNTSRWSVPSAPLGTFYGTLITAFSCGSQTAGAEVPFTLDGTPPPGPRAPNPAPGTRLPLPSWGAGVIERLAAERPDLLNQSCREHGGNNRFMFEAVRRLRARDNRFGLNWKRGLVGDVSQDIVTYNPTDQSDEGNRSPYIVDIIGGHCGSRPSAAWIDQTDATRRAGTIGIWTLIPYLDAGYPIVSDQQ